MDAPSTNMPRRVPRWSELAPLVGLAPPRLRRASRVAAAASIPDLRRLARGRAPRAVFDYVDGGADSELSLWRSRRAFRDVEFRPRVLRDVAQVDLSRDVLGARAAMPLVLAPTGFTRMMHAAGEPAVVRPAADHGVPYALSTMGTSTPEQVEAAAPDARRWFQLYVWQDRDSTEQVLERVARCGYEALVLTVDTPVPGARLRDVRNGLTIPPRLTWRTLADIGTHPAWWLDLLTTEPLEFATLSTFDGTVAELVAATFDPSVTWADLAWLRQRWHGPLILKGIQTVEDARVAVDHGVDGVVLSNHGGRQLDRAPTPLYVLPEVVQAVGTQVAVFLDGGTLHGADIVAAVAKGATAVLVGRAYLYGLMAGGEAGVDRVLTILRDEMTRTLQLMGVGAVDDLGPDDVVLGRR